MEAAGPTNRALAVFADQDCCNRELLEEGAGADPSQRTGTRLGGVVSSRDCRVDVGDVGHNTVKTVSIAVLCINNPKGRLHWNRVVPSPYQELSAFPYCLRWIGAIASPG